MKHSIAIDGPAGAGKSTVAKRVAKKLHFLYIDTGSMYRAMACYFIEQGVSAERFLNDWEKCAWEDAQITIQHEKGVQLIFLNGKDISNQLRTEEIGKLASLVAAQPQIKQKLIQLQQQIALKEDVVMDGRDIGTHVLPNAELKIYLTATVAERAKRRFLELRRKGISCDLKEIEKMVQKRDQQDMERTFAPLKQAEDAIYMDASNLSIIQVVNQIVEIYNTRIKE